jgi:competence ComEA-like helix-hairpin-helix protein
VLPLSKQEQLILCWISSVVVCGLIIDKTVYFFPQVVTYGDVIERDVLIRKLDVNKACLDELIALPGIGSFTAQKIIEYRKSVGKIKTLEELEHKSGVRSDLYKEFARYLKVK